MLNVLLTNDPVAPETVLDAVRLVQLVVVASSVRDVMVPEFLSI